MPLNSKISMCFLSMCHHQAKISHDLPLKFINVWGMVPTETIDQNLIQVWARSIMAWIILVHKINTSKSLNRKHLSQGLWPWPFVTLHIENIENKLSKELLKRLLGQIKIFSVLRVTGLKIFRQGRHTYFLLIILFLEKNNIILCILKGIVFQNA